VLAQASGPLVSGILRDLTGDYRVAFYSFTVLSVLAAAVALVARRPQASTGW
jgi:cyanate permease